jgi:polyhydroxybutyrate depolymerase
MSTKPARRRETRWRAAVALAASVVLPWASACGSAGAGPTGPDGGADHAAQTQDAGGPDVDRVSKDTGAADRTTPRARPDAAELEGGDAGVGEAGACGTRTGMRGITHRMMTVAGLARTYIIYLPPSLDPKTPVPFVFVHHGYTMTGQEMIPITQYKALADAQGIGVAFPDGEGGSDLLAPPWNVGTDVCPSTLGVAPSATGNDFAFLDAMQADVSNDQCLDTTHLFVTGFSMGGYFAHEVGCDKPNIRAVAPHSGGTHDLSSCTNGHKPIIIFHGDSDPVVPYGCDVPGTTDTPPGFTPSATEWAVKNGCGSTTSSVAVDNGTCYYYAGCPSDGQVAYCVFDGMHHCWAGGGSDGGIYSCPDYQSATLLEWDFWKKYAW